MPGFDRSKAGNLHMQRVDSGAWIVVSDMRHNRVVARRGHRRAFQTAFSAAAATTAAAAALGYAIAFSPLAGWAALGVGGAVAACLWLESRSGRTATPAPLTRVFSRRGGE
jgi:hypothetical protein